MRSIVLGVLLSLGIGSAQATPEAGTQSPLVPMTWTGGGDWILNAAVASPDCGFAVELVGPEWWGPQVRWARLDGGAGSVDAALLPNDTNVQTKSPRFFYSASAGFLPALHRVKVSESVEEIIVPPANGVAATISAPAASGQHTSYNLRTIPRAGRLPLFENVRLEMSAPPLSFYTRTIPRIYVPETGERQIGSGVLDVAVTSHAPDGTPIFFAKSGGRLGRVDESSTGELRLLEPTVEVADAPLAVAASSTGYGALIPRGPEVDFVTWDGTSSRTYPLRSLGGTVNGAASSTWDAMAFCEALPGDRWLVALQSSLASGANEVGLWIIHESEIQGWTRDLGLGDFEWSVDLSVRTEPLFAFGVVEKHGSAEEPNWNSRVTGVRWLAAANKWVGAPLASMVSDRGLLQRVTVGHDLEMVPTVCFQETTFEPGTRDITVYRAAIPEAPKTSWPMPGSSSPLVAMEWTGEGEWHLTAARPSPDCDYAVELRQPPYGSLQEIRWGRTGTGELDAQQATLQLDPLSETNYQLRGFDFYYSPPDGFLPLLGKSSTGSRDLVKPNANHDVVAHSVGEDAYTVSDLDFYAIPRPNALPLIASAIRESIPDFPFQNIYRFLYIPETGLMSLEPTVLRTAFAAHGIDGKPIFFAKLDGRLGRVDEGSADTLRLLEPTVPAPTGGLLAVGQSASEYAVLHGVGYNGFGFLSWNGSTSRSLILKPDSGAKIIAPSKMLMRICEPMPGGRWLVAYGASLWVIDGDQVTPWQSQFSRGDFSWDVDLSVPTEPLFALCTVERSFTNAPTEFYNASRVTSVAWHEDDHKWVEARIAILNSPNSVLRRVAVGRNAAQEPMVTFSEDVVNDRSGIQGQVYRVAIPDTGLLPAEATGWAVE